MQKSLGGAGTGDGKGLLMKNLFETTNLYPKSLEEMTALKLRTQLSISLERDVHSLKNSGMS